MRVRITLSVDVDAETWAADNDCSLAEVRGQVCASVVNTLFVEYGDYFDEIREVERA